MSNWYLKPLNYIKRSFASEVANISDRKPGIVFHTLQYLRLTTMDFLSTHEKLSSTISFGILRSLSLRLCKGWEELLHSIRNSSPTISLKSLSIETDSHTNNAESALALASFLDAFKGLEELYVSVASFSKPLSIWDSALCHKKSLRRLVYQQLSHDSDPLGDPAMAFTPSEVKKLSADVSPNPLAGLNLEFLGICCNNFNILVRQTYRVFVKCSSLTFVLIQQTLLSSPSISDSIRVLHLRVTEWQFHDMDDVTDDDSSDSVNDFNMPPSLYTFMSWAFGPTGPPYLHVIGHFYESPSGRLTRPARTSAAMLSTTFSGHFSRLTTGHALTAYQPGVSRSSVRSLDRFPCLWMALGPSIIR